MFCGKTDLINDGTGSFGKRHTKLMDLCRRAKAFEAEIAVLESRKSDESYVEEGLHDLQEKRTFLEGLS